VSLGEGMTPLIHLKKSGPSWVSITFISKTRAHPTGTFQGRGAAVGVSRAKKLGVKYPCPPMEMQEVHGQPTVLRQGSKRLS
jgi:threonine synthase